MRGPDSLLAEAQRLAEHLARLNRRWACERPECDGHPHDGWLHEHARASQRQPEDYLLWALIAGRGFGKTRTGSETVREWCQAKPRHIAVFARTDREVRNICFEGRAGLMAVLPPWEVSSYNRAVGDSKIILRNGSVIRAFTAENPDAVRGYAFDGAWLDEYGAWYPPLAQPLLDNLMFALRESAEPRVVITTTPRRAPHVRALLKRADSDPGVVITRGRTADNAANLSEVALAELVARYGGTRLGRQELDGELVEDVEGALWTWPMLEAARASEVPDLWRIVVAIDPAVTSNPDSDETGIVVVGASGSRRSPDLWVLEDRSGRFTPDGWARVAVDAYEEWKADAIVGEVNNGGDLVESVIRTQARRGGSSLRYKAVRASRGKRSRAEPIAALYEQGRVHHTVPLPDLEDQMTGWTVDSPDSPDRLDALVWGCSELSNHRGGMATVA